MRELPRGTVAFLFTDVAGSTRLWRDAPAAMAAAYARHDAILQRAVAEHGGIVYKVIGDAFQAAFASAPAAIGAALEAQRGLLNEPWDACGLLEPLRIRMALHAGAVDPDADGDYRSAVSNRAGRLLATAHGGQIVLSSAIQELVWEALPPLVSLRDLGEHRLQDLDQPCRILQLAHPDLPGRFPPLSTLEEQPHNLPPQPTTFLGREAEITAVRELLQREDVRLATLTGPGGTGKSRLAVRSAWELLSNFSDGVWFVDLAPLTDPSLVLAAIADVLGMRDTAAGSLLEQLARELGDNRVLLVLDNFEHVVDAGRTLTALLSRCPGLKLMITSRIALHVTAEHEFPVAPLALPQRYPPPTLEQLSQYDAVRLFVDRARAVRPDFAVDNSSAPAVAEICHRLDGLPLAIELAAARVRLLNPEALLNRLEKRLPLLVGGAKDLPDRQQTLRQAISWSYDLLPAGERTLFRALSVFAGGFTLEAAEAVAGATGAEGRGIAGDIDVLDGLEKLIDQNLLRQTCVESGDHRFAMLETIREYGLEQLAQTSDDDAIRRAHAIHYAGFVIGSRQDLATGVARTVARVATERDNIRAMLTWALEAGEVDLALQAASSMSEYWTCTGSEFGEGRAWLDRALAQGDGAASASRAYALYGLAMMTLLRGDVAAACAAAEEALMLARRAGDPGAIVGALYWLSNAYNTEGRAEAALPLAEESVRVARDMNSIEWRAWTLVVLGLVRHGIGDLTGARASLGEALAESRRLQQPWCEAHAATTLGLVVCDLGGLPWAAQLHAEALAAHHPLGPGISIPFSLVGLADVAQKAGCLNAAAWLLGAAETHFSLFGYNSYQDIPARIQRITSSLREHLGEEGSEDAMARGRALSTEAAIADAIAFAQDHAAAGRTLLSA